MAEVIMAGAMKVVKVGGGGVISPPVFDWQHVIVIAGMYNTEYFIFSSLYGRPLKAQLVFSIGEFNLRLPNCHHSFSEA